MGEVQATLEGLVKAHHFFNIDLFQRGYYAVGARLHVVSKLPFHLELEALKSSANNKSNNSIISEKSRKSGKNELDKEESKNEMRGRTNDYDGLSNGSSEESLSSNESPSLLFASAPFRVLFRNEVIPVDVQSRFRLHLVVPTGQIQMSVDGQIRVELELQLFFSESPPTACSISSMSLVSSRKLELDLDSARGLHAHQSVLFDYFHLAAVSVSVHSCLVSVHKAYIRNTFSKSTRRGRQNRREQETLCNGAEETIEDVFFATNNRSSGVIVADEQSARLIGGRRIHEEICSLLLQSFESLYKRLRLFCVHIDFDEDVAKWVEAKEDLAQCKHRLKILVERAQKTELEDQFVTLATNHMAQLSGELVMLWHAFIAAACKRHSEKIAAHLANEAHQMRVRRFSEGFFRTTHPCNALLDCEDKTKHANLAEKTRGSQYFNSLPKPSLFCVDLDGDASNVPIIFEDVYGDNEVEVVVVNDGDDECGHTMSETSIPKANCKAHYTNNNSNQSRTSISESFKSSTSSLFKPSTIDKINNSNDWTNNSNVADNNKLGNELNGKKMNGFSHVTWSHNVPYNMAEEPETDDDNTSFIAPLKPPRNRLRGSRSQEMLFKKDSNQISNYKNRFNSELQLSIGEKSKNERLLEAPSLVAQIMLPRRSISASEEVEERYNTDLSSALSIISGDLSQKSCLESIKENQIRQEPTTTSITIATRTTTAWAPTTTTSTSMSGSTRSATTTSTTRTATATRPSAPFCRSSSPLVPSVRPSLLRFAQAKEAFKQEHLKHQPTALYSEQCCITSITRYLDTTLSTLGLNKDHLVICVHGLEGNCVDLRLFKVYLEMALPDGSLDFLMSEVNQSDTFQDLDAMTDRLVEEILQHIGGRGRVPQRISFIGHSLGAVLVRSAISRPQMRPMQHRFHTFLSLSGPHLGTLYNSSGIVNMGMWLMQKWKKSASLLQLALKDGQSVRQSFLYRLSKRSNLQCFRHLLLAGSTQDRYVPSHSARIEMCETAAKDASNTGIAYREMVNNVLGPLESSARCCVIRYDVQHVIASNSTNALIGRAAHIAVLDSELFVEKLLLVSALKYFT